MDILFLHNSGGQETKISMLAGLVPSETLRESLFHAFLLAPGATGNPWHSLDVFTWPLSLGFCSVSLSPILSLIGQPPLDSGPILMQDDLEILTLITYAKTLIQIKSHSEVPSGHISWWPLVNSSQADITLITWIGKASLQEVKLSKSQKLLVKVPELEDRTYHPISLGTMRR